MRVLLFLEAPPGIGPGMKVLQTSALPLGYGEIALFIKGFWNSLFASARLGNRFGNQFYCIFTPL